MKEYDEIRFKVRQAFASWVNDACNLCKLPYNNDPIGDGNCLVAIYPRNKQEWLMAWGIERMVNGLGH
jgi:hypothetical protein